MKKRLTRGPEKWGIGKGAILWWDNLTLEEKQKYKSHYEAVREWNFTRKLNQQYPNMYDTTIIRISQLSPKHILRIRVFSDHPIGPRIYN